MTSGAEVQLVGRQVLVGAAVLTVTLVALRLTQAGTDLTFTALLVDLTVVGVTAGLWSGFVRSWRSFARTWLVAFIVLAVGGQLALAALNGWSLAFTWAASAYLLFPAAYALLAFSLGGLWRLLRRARRARRG